MPIPELRSSSPNVPGLKEPSTCNATASDVLFVHFLSPPIRAGWRPARRQAFSCGSFVFGSVRKRSFAMCLGPGRQVRLRGPPVLKSLQFWGGHHQVHGGRVPFARFPYAPGYYGMVSVMQLGAEAHFVAGRQVSRCACFLSQFPLQQIGSAWKSRLKANA